MILTVLLTASVSSADPDTWFAPLDRAANAGAPIATRISSLFQPEAQWDRASTQIRVFKIYPAWVLTASQTELQGLAAGLASRNVELALEIDPFEAGEGCGQGVSGFAYESGVAAAERIRASGGALRYIVLNRPIFAGMIYQGTNACLWTAEEMSSHALDQVRSLLDEFPDAVAGIVEPVPGEGSAERRAQYLSGIQALQRVLPLAFFHV